MFCGFPFLFPGECGVTQNQSKLWIAFVVEWLLQFILDSRICANFHLYLNNSDLSLCIF